MSQSAAVGVVWWLNWHFHLGDTAAVFMALLPTLPGAYLTWAAYRDDRAEANMDLDVKARVLAAAVKAAERDQAAQLLGAGGRRIDLLFEYVPESANDAVGAAEQGHLADVLTYYRTLNPRRLIITGEPGAGKTLLALQLLLDILDDPARADTDPIPVRVSLAGWDTHQPLTAWLAQQISQRYNSQGITPDAAYKLVDQRRVLPVLDGLDEMDTAVTPPGRRRAAAAVELLNDYPDTQGSAPVVLTCRSEQHEELAQEDLRMRDAARVRILPVSEVQAKQYLTARTTTPERWAPVLDSLNTAPTGTLARALNTPWRLNLAVTVYEQRDPVTRALVRDPADLLSLTSPSEVRDHLLAHRIEAAVAQHSGPYTPAQVHCWLGRLARFLAGPAGSPPSTDLILHELWALPGPFRVRTVDALVTAAVPLLCAAFLMSHAPPGIFFLLVPGMVGAVLAALTIAVSAADGDLGAPHIAMRLRHHMSNPAQRRQLVRKIATAVTGGTANGLFFGLLLWWRSGPAVGLVTGLISGTLMVGALTVGWLTSELTGSSPDDGLFPPGDPRHPIRDDLLFGLATALALALAAGLPIGYVGNLTAGLPTGLAFGVTFGLTGGVAFGLCTAFCAGRRYLVFLCVCRGRLLPWRLGAFLHWSYDAELLRISGIAYQFRHRELQDWLTANPAP
jgi:hypothetical protein